MRRETTKRCVDCGSEKARESFSANMWRWKRRDRACLSCVQRRLVALTQWHNTQQANRTATLRLAQEWALKREAERTAYLASISAAKRRRRIAQSAIRKWKTSIIARDGYVCGLCHNSVEPQDVSLDHILPITRGGSDDVTNLQVAHRLCNSQKGNRVGANGA